MAKRRIPLIMPRSSPQNLIISVDRCLVVMDGKDYYYYYYYAAFNAPCVGHKDDESQARGSLGSTGSS